MKPPSSSTFKAILLATTAALILHPLALTAQQPDPPDTPVPEPQLKVDPNPLPRETPPSTSFSPIVKKVSASVVNVYTTRHISAAEARSAMSELDDPTLRQFFGEGGIPMPDRERDREPEQQQQGLGSGVIVSADGLILTNNHVIQNADEIKVARADNATVYDAELVGTDAQTDIAVLRVKATGLPAITVADSDQVEVGDVVLAIGNPFGIGQTVTAGIVSAKGRGGMGIVDYEDFIQTDASINPGNSGGALVNAAGRLVGINTAILSRSGANNGVGFAVPTNLAHYVMDRLVSEGKVVRGYLGVMLQPLTPALANELKAGTTEGALIGDLAPDSPAEAAGMKAGDIITGFDGKKITDSRQLRLIASQTSPGKKVEVKTLRDGAEQRFEVELQAMPERELADRGKSNRDNRKPDRRDTVGPLDGMAVEDLDARTRRALRLPATVKNGAVVVEIAPTSPAAAAGLEPGDIILEINRKPVANADEAIEASQHLEGDTVMLRVWSRGASGFVIVEGKEGDKDTKRSGSNNDRSNNTDRRRNRNNNE
jgi:serine protease Do